MLEILEKINSMETRGFENEDDELSIDIDKMSLNEMEQLLTAEEKAGFESMLKSQKALDCIIEIWQPWWRDKCAVKPALLNIPNFEPKVLELRFALVDFCLSYLITKRTFNGDFSDDYGSAFQFFHELSFVFNAAPNFSFESTKQTLELMRVQILLHSSKISLDCLELFHQDLLLIFSTKENVKRCLSDSVELFEKAYSVIGIKEAFGLAKKLSFYAGICFNLEEICIDLQLNADSFIGKELSVVELGQKPLITEITNL